MIWIHKPTWRRLVWMPITPRRRNASSVARRWWDYFPIKQPFFPKHMPQGSYQDHLCSQLQKKKKKKFNYVITSSQCAFFMPRLCLSAVCGAALFEECNNGATEPFHLQGSVSPSGSLVCSQSNWVFMKAVGLQIAKSVATGLSIQSSVTFYDSRCRKTA